MKYEVTIRDIEVFTIEVEAENQAEAQDLALEKFDDDATDKFDLYHNNSDMEVEVNDL